MKYMLDTDIVSLAVRGNPSIIKNLKMHEEDEIFVSAITYAELMYGLEKKGSTKLADEVSIVLGKLCIKDFDIDSAEYYGKIRLGLERPGAPLENMDMLIAAAAMSIGAILITHNTKHFGRIKGLKVEDWS
ncbi:MAG: type II toxin-antitoxin system VapC family toxin [Rickettsiales bacterium]|jgi:tRNA(fMet)-specific endonuclease VapC|nr:type II toxin-antitoxin system VapC family toxin [Rickettsiales bacterium]